MFRQKERQIERTLDEQMPYVRHVSPLVFETEDRGLCAMLELSGVSFATKDYGTLNFLQERLSNLFKSLFADGLTIWVNIVRVRAHPPPVQAQLSPFACDLSDRYHRATCVDLFENRIFLTLGYLPPSLLNIGGFKKSSKLIFEKQLAAADSDALLVIEEKIKTLFEALIEYEPRYLRVVEREGVLFSEPMEAIYLALFAKNRQIPLVTTKLANAFCQDVPVFGWSIIEHRYGEQRRYAQILTLKDLAAKTNALTITPYVFSSRFEWSAGFSFKFEGKNKTLEKVGSLERQLSATNQEGALYLELLDQAREGLMLDESVFGIHHAAYQVFADDFDLLDTQTSDMLRHLTASGAVFVREDLANIAAWLSLAPLNLACRVRTRVVSQENFADTCPFFNYSTGDNHQLEWEKPVCFFKTPSHSIFNFSFHHRGLGNTFICGVSGSGKTVLQTFFCAMLEAFNTKRIVFDKDCGQEIFIRACGGEYTTLKHGVDTGFKILSSLSNTPEDITFLAKLLHVILKKDQKDETLEKAAKSVLSKSVKERSFSLLSHALSYAGDREIIKYWRAGERNGWLFDSAEPKTFFSSDLSGFDITTILDDSELRTPCLLYIFHLLAKQFDGERIVIFIDEFWKVLNDSVFSDFIRDKLKTIRKQNGFLVLATQSPSDALESTYAKTIIEQCNTQIFLSNPRAHKEEYIDGFKLNDREYKYIVGGMKAREFLIKQGDESHVVTLDLGFAPDLIKVMSGTTANINLLHQLIEKYGETPAEWMPHLIKGEKRCATY